VKNTILCGALVLAAGGGVAFVVANRPAEPPVAATAVSATPAVDDDAPDAPCPTCKTGGASVVYDVTDLSAAFAAKREAKGQFVSFEEPPLARPAVQPVGHELPAEREVLPPPREVK
jgi:hypothetical protein